jgi:starch-binding outer membrane protein, SusD/RagB family
MRNRNIKFNLTVCVFLFSLFIVSCTDYLDKSPQADINQIDAFKDFKSFQGFVEEMYSAIPDPHITNNGTDVSNYADEMLCSLTGYTGYYFDNGNYWGWQTAIRSFLTDRYGIQTGENAKEKGLWSNAWYCIRKANLGLENMNLLVNATQEQKDVIKGQLLFFRGYYYFELMKWWGGLPYLDHTLSATDNMNLGRLNYRETALKAAQDLGDAAALLPVSWDKATVGQATLGNNKRRVSKATALAFMGKDLLYAASPCMNLESTGNANFDQDLCKQAASAFAQVITLCEGPNPPYSLQTWETYSDMFYLNDPTKKLPGGVEVMWQPGMTDIYRSAFSCVWSVGKLIYVSHNFSPTANYIKNYGMANGLPIDDPESGYNPNEPWVGRDPRFYQTIVIDGEQVAISTSAGADQFIQLYTGGRHRGGNDGSVTGYLTKKYWGIKDNNFDGVTGYNYQTLPSLLRLSDVYLMYAEAVLQGYGTPQSSVSGSQTAEEAVNKIRNRAGVPNVDAKFTADKQKFMSQIILERAVELAYEGFRWNDLQRWMISGETKYKEKTILNFDRDPLTKKPVNIKEVLLVTRVFEKKHYWLPLPIDQVTLNGNFKQNPGW